MLRRRGFTLIELLVVIAIIGILAAMLFPVFARARESARKTQCLANVKNIAIAFQMYLTDYDRFPPGEMTRGRSGRSPTPTGAIATNFAPGAAPTRRMANPYLRWPVILDDYTKNRDIWRCPSAKSPASAQWIVGSSNWLKEVVDVYEAGCQGCPCQVYWPNGWGGSVTDSLYSQGETMGDVSTGAFEVDYHSNERRRPRPEPFHHQRSVPPFRGRRAEHQTGLLGSRADCLSGDLSRLLGLHPQTGPTAALRPATTAPMPIADLRTRPAPISPSGSTTSGAMLPCATSIRGIWEAITSGLRTVMPGG